MAINPLAATPQNGHTMSDETHDPNLYHKLSEPFASIDEADESVQAFFAEVRAAREKHRIKDTLIVVMVSVADGGTAMTSAFNGNELEIEGMAAWMLGQASADRQARIMRLIGSAKAIHSGGKGK